MIRHDPSTEPDSVRKALVEKIRAEIQDGSYLTPERLHESAERMMEQLNEDEPPPLKTA